jgi:hypothetical protein
MKSIVYTTYGVPMRHLILVAFAVLSTPVAFAAPTSADAQMNVSVEVVPACRIQAPAADRTVDAQAAVTWSWTCGSTAAHVSVNGVVDVKPAAEGQVTVVVGASKSYGVQLDF